MRRNCNLELRLSPFYDSGHNHPIVGEGNNETESPQQQQQQQQQQNNKLTIFYDGKICVSDVTELQARWILMAANKEMEERVKTPNGSGSGSGSEPCSPQVYSPNTSLSMKRSLQRFLQKRKTRNQESSPYHHS